MSVVNSFLLYNSNQAKSGGKEISHQQYRQNLVVQLVGTVRNTRKKRGQPSSLDTSERLNGQQHWVGRLVGDRTKDCAVCSNRKAKGERRKTVFYCKTCSRQPGLHPVDCFQRYHTLSDYPRAKVSVRTPVTVRNSSCYCLFVILGIYGSKMCLE